MKRLWLYGLLFLLHFALFWPFYAGEKDFVYRDLLYQHIPVKAEAARQWREGHLPLWDEKSLNGQPILANPNYAPLYPATLLFSPRHPFRSTTLILLLHHLILGLGIILLGRKLTNAPFLTGIALLTILLSGPILSAFAYYNMLVGIAWIPWILLARLHHSPYMRYFVLTLLMGLIILSGFPFALFAALFLLLFMDLLRATLSWRGVALYAGATASALFLCAVEILPGLLFLPHSLKTYPIPYADSLGYFSFHPVRIVEFLIPHLFGNPLMGLKGAFWGNTLVDSTTSLLFSPYLGIVALLLFILIPINRKRVALWTALFVIIMAMGRFAGFHKILTTLIPPLAALRYPEKFLLLLPFIVALLLLHAPDKLDLSRWKTAILLSLSGILLLGYSLAGSWAPGFLSWGGGGRRNPGETLYAIMTIRHGLLFAFIIVVALISILKLIKSQNVKLGALFFLVLLDLLMIKPGLLPGMEARTASAVPSLAGFLQRDGCRRIYNAVASQAVMNGGGDRHVREGSFTRFAMDSLFPQSGSIYGLAYALNPPVDNMETKAMGMEALAAIKAGIPPPSLLRILGVTHIIHDAEKLPFPVASTRSFGDLTISRLRGGAPFWIRLGGKEVRPGEGTMKGRGAERELDVTSSEPGVVITPITFAPGWRVYLGPRRITPVETRWGTIGIPIEPGDSSFRLLYRTPGLGPGLVISFITLVLLLFGLALQFRHRGEWEPGPD